MVRRAKRKQRIEPSFDANDEATLDVRPTRPAAANRKAPSKKRKTPAKSRAKTAQGAKSRSGTARRGGSGGKGSGGGRRGGSKNKRRTSGWLIKAFRRSMYWGSVAGIWGIIFAVGVLGYYAAHLPPTSEWEVPKRPPNVKIVAADGTLIANRGDTGGEAVRLEQLPPYLPEAVIAIEDRRFLAHFGVDPVGLIRAVYTNLTKGTVVQGGSTLTQQLAKNLFLEPDRTLKRKMQELVLALWLEAKFSKDEILEMYLNRVYLGSGAYGVDAAARRYFGKSARLVTVAEAATLAALLKAPSRYAPTRNPELAESRAQLVLAAMHEEGYIDEAEAKNALAAPAQVVSTHTSASENYAADWVMDLLPHYVGSIDGDIIVDTTIDLRMQNAAEAALRRALGEHSSKLGVRQGAVVTLDTAGAVRAIVGGRDYAQSQFNRAVYAKRQPGSAFKPFVYLAALERGLTPQTIRRDEPVSIRGWSPKNYTKKHYGPVTLTRSLSLSLNTVAAKLAQEVGPKTVANTAQRLGVSSKLKANPSLALGTSEVTPLEIAGAYVPFSNGGYGVIPHIVRRIRTVGGKTLYAREGSGPGRVIDRSVLGGMNVMMAETLVTGTGRKAQLDGFRPAGGKTGTSQDFRDAWFIGYTGNLTTAVWLGNDDNSPTKRATGGSLPAVIWKEAMQEDHEGLPVASLPGVRDVPVQVAKPKRQRNVTPRAEVGSGGDVIRPPAGSGGGGPLDLIGRLFGG